jgi:hypothetical protein
MYMFLYRALDFSPVSVKIGMFSKLVKHLGVGFNANPISGSGLATQMAMAKLMGHFCNPLL